MLIPSCNKLACKSSSRSPYSWAAASVPRWGAGMQDTSGRGGVAGATSQTALACAEESTAAIREPGELLGTYSASGISVHGRANEGPDGCAYTEEPRETATAGKGRE